MRHDHAKLNDLARAEIDALRAGGVMPTDEEIVELNALAWAVETPEARRHLSRGVPVQVGSAWLWPLTLCAADWLERVGAAMDPGLYGRAIAYAMSHAYAEGHELDLEGASAEKAVKGWARRLRCTPAELIEAVEQVQAQDEDPEMPGGDPDAIAAHAGMSRGDYSAFLVAATGQTPEFWERRCAQGYTFAVLQAVIRQKMAEAGAPVKDDAKIKAEIALGWAAEKARRRWAADMAEKTVPCDG
jgi:hypothetical protein